MFHIAKNGIITLHRGDTFTLPILINLCIVHLRIVGFNLKEGDQVIFRLMRANEKSEDATIEKVYTVDDLNEDGAINVIFTNDDTNWLDPDTYYYEVQLRYYSNDMENVNTFIPRTKFYIVE